MFLMRYQKVSSVTSDLSYPEAEAKVEAEEFLYVLIQSRLASGLMNEGTNGIALATASLPRKERRWLDMMAIYSYGCVKPLDEVRKSIDLVA